MKTHTETIDIQVPDGYTITEYRKPKEGETYLRPRGEAKEADFDFDVDSHPILEKTHKLPEIVYCFPPRGKEFQPILCNQVECKDGLWKASEIVESLGKITICDSVFDLFLVEQEDELDERWIVAGHWNDGPKS